MAMVFLPLGQIACDDDDPANGGKGGSGGAAGSAAGAGGRGGSAGRGGTGGRGGTTGGSGGATGGAGVAGSSGGTGGTAGAGVAGTGGGGAGGRGGAGGSAGGGSGGSGGSAGASGSAGAGGRGGGAGTAGVGGSGGTGGSGGAGGSTGTAGSGATAGAAGGASGAAGASGASGTAGASGAAGAGGTAGATGAAGTGGAAGAGGTTGGGAGGGGAGGAGGTAGAGGNNCALPPTDAGAPPAANDSIVFLPNVTVTTLAGGGTPGATNGATGTLNNPVSVAIEADGNVVVSDFDNSRLRRVIAADGTLSTLTMQSDFQRPFGLAVAGSILYAHTDNNPSGQRNTTTGTIWRIEANGVATAVGPNLGRPRGIAALSDGRLALGDYQNQRVRIFDPATGNATDLAGLAGCSGSANGTGTSARFVQPYGVAVLAGDRIIVADHEAHVLREVSLAGAVTTFAGDGGIGTIDGPRLSARFMGPKALAADASGAIFVSDDSAHRIRRIAADGTVTTVAGDGTGGFMDGSGNVAQFFGQEGIAVSGNGATIYVADGTGGAVGPYHRIRKIVIAP